MHSPITAQIWEIWNRKRTLSWIVAGLLAFGGIFNYLFADTIRFGQVNRLSTGAPLLLNLLNEHLLAAVLLLVLSILGYTEFNPQKDSHGFPHRLYVLPITTFQLVAVPMLLSVAAILGVSLMIRLFSRENTPPLLLGSLGLFMVLYQAVLWMFSGSRSLRMIVLGLIAIILIMAPIFPSVRRLPESVVIAVYLGLALVTFVTSWAFVAWQRSGGTFCAVQAGTLVEAVADRAPRRNTVFHSAQAAQFWLEWRRCGSVLPLLVAALVVIAIAPLSWVTQGSGPDSGRILAATLAMPMILALALGKAFSRPDFWSGDLSIPAFIAVKPLSTLDIVATKMKVAAVSTVLSWVVVLAFLSIWLPLWANLDSIAMIRGVLWQIHGHSVYPQYAIAVLGILASMLLTWRFLVGGLWLGLSGKTKIFGLAAVPYVLVPLFAIPGLFVALRFNQSLLAWIQDNADRLLPILVWTAAAAVILKAWTAALSWRGIPLNKTGRYLLIWLFGTSVMLVFAVLVWGVLGALIPSDAYRLRNLFIFGAVLAIPIARIGLAPASLDRNRHR